MVSRLVIIFRRLFDAAVDLLSGLMTEKARAKVMATVSRLDRNVDSDIGSDFDYESMSDFETDDEDQEDAAKGKLLFLLSETHEGHFECM